MSRNIRSPTTKITPINFLRSTFGFRKPWCQKPSYHENCRPGLEYIAFGPNMNITLTYVLKLGLIEKLDDIVFIFMTPQVTKNLLQKSGIAIEGTRKFLGRRESLGGPEQRLTTAKFVARRRLCNLIGRYSFFATLILCLYLYGVMGWERADRKELVVDKSCQIVIYVPPEEPNIDDTFQLRFTQEEY